MHTMLPWSCAVWLPLGIALCGTASSDSAEQPNLLLILADDVGQECLGCYGGESYRTPYLDALASTGIRFRHCYSMPACHPTRLALMTGKYPFRHGKVRWGDFPNSEEQYTFSQLLSRAGYATCVAGKWQLALLREQPDHPQRLGFDHSDVFGWHEGPRYYQPLIYRNGIIRDDTLGHYGPDLYVRSLIEFMKSNRKRPFLAYFPMALCHDVTDDLEAPVPHGPLGRYDSYQKMVEEMDRSIGRLVAALDALQLRQQTVILFVGDNGTPRRMIARADGDQLIKEPIVSQRRGQEVWGGKATLLDGGTRVPLIVNWPGTVPARQVVDDLVDMSDFLPTLAELAGVELPADRAIDGISFASRLLRSRAAARQWVFSQQALLPLPGGALPSGTASGLCWVRNQRWKLYNNGQLFDMQADPGEKAPGLESNDSAAMKLVREELAAALAYLGRKL